MTDMEKLERLFTEAAVAAGEAARNPETADPTFQKGVYAEGVTRMNEENVQVTVKYKIADENNDSSIKKQIKEHASQLEAMIAVERVTYTPINKKQLHEKVSEKFKTIGYKVERQNFGTIEIGEKQIDKSINYINSDGEKAALFAIPAVLKRGVVVDGHENHKDRGYETITIAAPIEVNGTRGIVGAVVTKIDERNKYRVHRILTPDGSEFTFEVKTKDTEPTSGEPSSSDKRAPIGSASEKSITQPEKSVNRKYSISEENSSDRLYSIDDSAEVSESKREETPFEKALRRSGLAHLIDGGAEAESGRRQPGDRGTESQAQEH
jgi:hypothetical protein